MFFFFFFFFGAAAPPSFPFFPDTPVLGGRYWVRGGRGGGGGGYDQGWYRGFCCRATPLTETWPASSRREPDQGNKAAKRGALLQLLAIACEARDDRQGKPQEQNTYRIVCPSKGMRRESAIEGPRPCPASLRTTWLRCCIQHVTEESWVAASRL